MKVFGSRVTLGRLVALPIVVVGVFAPSGLAAGAPLIAFSGGTGAYGTIDPGQTASQTFVLTNSGGSATAALTVAIGGPGAAQFTITGDECSATSLGPKKTCSVTIAYTPSAAGANDAATLTAAGKKSQASASLGLSGAGTAENHAPVANPDNFNALEGVGLQTLGNALSNDIDQDGDILSASSVENVAVDTSNAPAFSAILGSISDNDFSDGFGQITLTMSGIGSAVITIAADGTIVISDPNNIFDALGFANSVGVSFDYAVNDGSLSDSSSVTVQIHGVNDAPTDLMLSNSSVDENASGALVGTLAVIDPDAGDSHTFAVSDARFEVVGNTLKLKSGISLDYETEPSVVLNVTTTDNGGLSFIKTFVVNVNNVTE